MPTTTSATPAALARCVSCPTCNAYEYESCDGGRIHLERYEAATAFMEDRR